jgi:RNA polymerase sigma-70 factor (ECF subfamily)
VQETFAQVLRKARILRSGNELPYLLTVLRNTFISTHRTAARRPQTINPPKTMELFEDPTIPPPEDRFLAGDVYRAIAALPPDFRDAVVAIDVVGLSYCEAARALHVREATIATRLHRGRQRIARTVPDAFPGPPARAVRARRDSRPAV